MSTIILGDNKKVNTEGKDVFQIVSEFFEQQNFKLSNEIELLTEIDKKTKEKAPSIDK